MGREDESGVENGRRRARWVEVGLIVVVFFVAAGDRPPHVNESHYLCRLKHYWDPAWCVGDLFLDSSDTQLLLIWLFGWVTRFASLTVTAWIGRLLAWTAIAWAWQQLSWRVVPRPYASVLSAALFIGLMYYCHLAGEWVVGGFEAKCFAYALVLTALREMIANHWRQAWVLLGAASAFHPLVGGWSGVLCAGVWWIDARREQQIPAMLPGLVLGGLLALIGILPALQLTRNVPPEVVDEAARIYVFDRLPHHLAPLTLPAEERTRRLVGHASLLIAMVLLSRVLRNSSRATGESPTGRLTSCPAPDDHVERRTPLDFVLQFAIGATLLAGTGLAIELGLSSRPQLAANLLRYYWFRLSDFAVAMAVALQITKCVASTFDRRRVWAVPAAIGAVLLAAWYPVTACWTRITSPNSPSDKKIANYWAWVETCDWVAAKTPPNALFITPRLNSSFKWRTGRPEVAIRKDIPQDARSIVEWSARIKELYETEFAGIKQMVDSVGALGTERVHELARKYRAQYVLCDRVQLLKLPIAYWNDEYVVYQMEYSSAGDGR